jgi:hypothetical protein
MNKIIILIVSLFLFGCNSSEEITVDTIEIQRIGQHPFLVDHSKKLVIKNNSGEIIDKVKLYSDPGSGCNSYLYENDEIFILIECNGQWYSIEKKNGEIKNLGWNWLKETPENLIGTFIRSSELSTYELIKGKTLPGLYKYKDPK